MSVSIDQYNALQAQMAQMMTMFQSLSASGIAPSVSGKPAKAKKERKPRSADAKPNPWIAFSSRVRATLKNSGHAGKELSTVGNQFCSYLKSQNADYDSWTDDSIVSAFSGWTAPVVSKQASEGKSKRARKSSTAGSDSGSVVSADASVASATADKPKRKSRFDSMTAEQAAEEKAKLAARLAEGRARKAAEKKAAAESSVVTAPVVVSAPVVTAPVVSAPVVTAPVVTATAEWKNVLLGGKRYMYNVSNFHCYHREADGTQGEWAGMLVMPSKPGDKAKIDDSVPEPSDDECDLDA